MTYVVDQNTLTLFSLAKSPITTCSSTSHWMAHSFIETRSRIPGLELQASSTFHQRFGTRERWSFLSLSLAAPTLQSTTIHFFSQHFLISQPASDEVSVSGMPQLTRSSYHILG